MTPPRLAALCPRFAFEDDVKRRVSPSAVEVPHAGCFVLPRIAMAEGNLNRRKGRRPVAIRQQPMPSLSRPGHQHPTTTRQSLTQSSGRTTSVRARHALRSPVPPARRAWAVGRLIRPIARRCRWCSATPRETAQRYHLPRAGARSLPRRARKERGLGSGPMRCDATSPRSVARRSFRSGVNAIADWPRTRSPSPRARAIQEMPCQTPPQATGRHAHVTAPCA